MFSAHETFLYNIHISMLVKIQNKTIQIKIKKNKILQNGAQVIIAIFLSIQYRNLKMVSHVWHVGNFKYTYSQFCFYRIIQVDEYFAYVNRSRKLSQMLPGMSSRC